MPQESSISHILENLPLEYHDPWWRNSRILNLIEKLEIDLDNKNTLDLGCAQGWLERSLFERGITNSKIQGWDHVDIRAEKNNYREKWIHKILDLSKKWPIDEKFDTIFALEIIEHMIDTDYFLENCKKISANNSYIIFSTPNIASLKNRLKLLFGKYPDSMEYRNGIHHVRMYTVPTIKSHLESHNYEVIKCIGVNFLPMTLHKFSLLRNLSNILANRFPSLCGNIILVTKVKSDF